MPPAVQEVTLLEAQEARISRDLWITRFLYFFFYAAMGVFFAYINVYYSSIGLSGTEIGLVNTIGPLVGAFSTTLWGMVSDRWGKTRLLFSLAGLGVIVSGLLLSRMLTLYGIIPVVAVYALFNSPIIPLLDSTTLRLLGPRREEYGRTRIWGTAGFIITSSTIGWVYERTGLGAIFYALAIVMAFFVLTALGMSNQPVRPNVSPMRGMGRMVRQPSWASFAFSVLLLWLVATGAITFVSVVLRDMGGSARLIGLVWTVAAIFEAPVMFFSGPLLRRYGPARLLAVAYTGYTLRIFLYGWMPAPQWALVINLLHGLSYVPFWLGAVTYASDLAPTDLKATAQGVLMTVMNLGSVLGALLAGWMFDAYGSQGMYYRLAVISLGALGAFLLGRRLFGGRQG